MKAVVAAFNQEKALVVGAFSVLTNLRMELFQALESTSKQPKQPDCPPGVSFPRVPERGCSWRVAAPRCAGPGERAAVSVSWDSAAAAACRDPDTAPVITAYFYTDPRTYQLCDHWICSKAFRG